MKNDCFCIGCIGVGSMGIGDVWGYVGFGDIFVVCDVDFCYVEWVKVDGWIGKGMVDVYEDYCWVFECDDIDVVSVVILDYWYVKIVIEVF